MIPLGVLASRRAASGDGGSLLLEDDFSISNTASLGGRSPSSGIPSGQTWSIVGTVPGNGTDYRISLDESGSIFIPGWDLSMRTLLTVTHSNTWSGYYNYIRFPFINDDNQFQYRARMGLNADGYTVTYGGVSESGGPGGYISVQSKSTITLEWDPSTYRVTGSGRITTICQLTEPIFDQLVSAAVANGGASVVFAGSNHASYEQVLYDVKMEYI